MDRDGAVYRLMPETWMARHTIGLNRVAIGIENVGGPRWPLTPEQLRADAAEDEAADASKHISPPPFCGPRRRTCLVGGAVSSMVGVTLPGRQMQPVYP